ncbi:MAG: hypothetical protein ACTSQ4_01295 [Candidatus Heimdallarchaeaceae archaeon]
MNEEKLNEVGALTDVDSKDITQNKFKKKITLVYYYFIQLGFLAISSLIGYIFGLYKTANNSYPYSGFDQSYVLGPLLVAILHGGNLGMYYKLSKNNRLIMKKGTNEKPLPFHIYPVVFLNILLSIFVFLLIYNTIISGHVFTATTDYGVYTRKKAEFYKK